MKNFNRRIHGLTTDSKFLGFLCARAIRIQEAWYNSRFLNGMRRRIHPRLITLKYKFGIRERNLFKVHLGCGNNHLKGYVNIDWRKTRATDLVCDIRKLPYHDNSIKLIIAYHVIEHLPRHDLPSALKEWNRTLVAGGKLIVEFPDFDEIVSRYLRGDTKQLDGIFGLQRFEGDYHFFGYNFERIKDLLMKGGFTNIQKKEARDYHIKEWPCIRVECIKDTADSSLPFPKKRTGDMTFTGERVVEGNTPERIWLDHVARYEFASRYVQGKQVLDISCGTGYGSHFIYTNGAARVIGVDISREAIEFARTQYTIDGLEFREGNILDIDFPRDYFDVITCFETIEHVNNPKGAFRELQRVLKPRGLLIISSPNRRVTSPGKSINESPDNPFHVIEYSTDEFIAVVSNYFKTLDTYGQRGIGRFLFISFVAKRMMKVLPLLYEPSRGSSELGHVSWSKEYRYITVVCQKTRTAN